jgi:hypothetical protein
LVGLGLFGGHAAELAEKFWGDADGDELFGVAGGGAADGRARRSSAAVDSGMSERSSWLSGIGLAFFARRLACADKANELLAMF